MKSRRFPFVLALALACLAVILSGCGTDEKKDILTKDHLKMLEITKARGERWLNYFGYVNDAELLKEKFRQSANEDFHTDKLQKIVQERKILNKVLLKNCENHGLTVWIHDGNWKQKYAAMTSPKFEFRDTELYVFNAKEPPSKLVR